jgi:hypothetical protein
MLSHGNAAPSFSLLPPSSRAPLQGPAQAGCAGTEGDTMSSLHWFVVRGKALSAFHGVGPFLIEHQVPWVHPCLYPNQLSAAVEPGPAHIGGSGVPFGKLSAHKWHPQTVWLVSSQMAPPNGTQTPPKRHPTVWVGPNCGVPCCQRQLRRASWRHSSACMQRLRRTGPPPRSAASCHLCNASRGSLGVRAPFPRSWTAGRLRCNSSRKGFTRNSGPV